jgi:hypothetical protein
MRGESVSRVLFLPTIVRLGYCCTSLCCHLPMALEILGQLQSLGSIAFKKPPRAGGPTGYGNSPYQPLSSFAGNGLVISPEWLIENGVLATRTASIRRFPWVP